MKELPLTKSFLFQATTIKHWSGTSSRCHELLRIRFWPTPPGEKSIRFSGRQHSPTGSPSVTTTAWRSWEFDYDREHKQCEQWGKIWVYGMINVCSAIQHLWQVVSLRTFLGVCPHKSFKTYAEWWPLLGFTFSQTISGDFDLLSGVHGLLER